MSAITVRTATIHGAHIGVAHVPWQRSLTAILRVDAGHGEDPPDSPGLAHICEHERIAHATTVAAPVAAAVNGTTHAAGTDFTLRSAATDWQPALHRLLGALHPGRLSPARLTNEIQAVLVEMSRTTGRPALRLAPLLAAATARDPGIAATSRATPSSVRATAPGAVDTFLTAHYHPAACHLVICSPIDPAAILDLLAATLPSPPPSSPQQPTPLSPAPLSPAASSPTPHPPTASSPAPHSSTSSPTPHSSTASPSAPHSPTASPSAPHSQPPFPPAPLFLAVADPELDGHLAMTIERERPHGSPAHRLAHAWLTATGGLLDRATAPTGRRITGAAELTGRGSAFTALGWGPVEAGSPLVPALVAALGTTYPEGGEAVRRQIMLEDGFALRTPDGLARALLRWTTGESPPPLSENEWLATPAADVVNALHELTAAARIWQVRDGLPHPVE